MRQLEGREVLAEARLPVELGHAYEMSLAIDGGTLTGVVDGVEVVAQDETLASGAVALVVDTGRTATEAVRVEPLG